MKEETIEVVENTDEKVQKPKRKSVLPIVIIAIFVIAMGVGAVVFMKVNELNKALEQGKRYIDAEEYDKAIEAYEDGIKAFSSSADAYLGLAKAYIGKGELSQAVTILDKGIKKTGSNNLEESKTVILDQIFATYVLDSYVVNIMPGESKQMSVINRSEDLNFSVSWSSKDENLVDIDENGLITAKADGTTEITATIGNEVFGYRDTDAVVIVGIMTTYLEEQGLEYVSSANKLTSPAFIYQENQDAKRIYDGTLEIIQPESVFSLTKCEISDPDAEGNVTYAIEYTITVPKKFGILPGSKESRSNWYYDWKVAEPILCDDYSGQIFTKQTLFGEDGVKFDSQVVWENMTFNITGDMSSEWENDENWEVTFDEDTSITWAEANAVGTYKLNISVPKEYQGLVLAYDKSGLEDYTDPEYESTYEYSEEEVKDSFFFDKLEDGSVRQAEDFQVIKLFSFAK